MSNEVRWTKLILDTFIAEACLTKDEEMIMRTRVAGWSRTKQAAELGMSLSTIDRYIKRLKMKYDEVAKYDPLLPPRKHSAYEDWQDNN